MTLREWYAGLAMQGAISAATVTIESIDGNKVAAAAFEIADAMIVKAAKKRS